MRSNSKTIKRSVSPYVPKENISGKKKPAMSSPYEKVIKDFESYGKAEKKKNSRYMKESIQKETEKHKFRIVTEPVDSGILHLGKSNIFNPSIPRIPYSNKKLQTQHRESTQQIKFNLKQKSQSKERIHTSSLDKCANCARYCDELDYLKRNLGKIINGKNMWKSGKSTLDDLKDFYNVQTEVGTNISKKTNFKVAETVLQEVKKNLYDLMKDIESLSQIDYPKMLSQEVIQHNTKIFFYDHSYSEYVDPHEAEIKNLFDQLRLNVEGKLAEYDTEDTFSENTYTKKIIRNLKSRLSTCLRQNLELRMKKTILERAQEISEESEEYLRRVIEEVLAGYSMKKY